METSSQQWMKMYNHVESLHILFELLPFLENKENDLEVCIVTLRKISSELWKYVSVIRRFGPLDG